MDRVRSVDENCIVVRNPVSSTVPGDAVRVELHTFSKNDIHSNEEIIVDFSGPTDDASFTVPETISKTNVQIGYGDRTHNPSSVLVQGRRVILTVPTDGGSSLEIQGDYTITFNQSAGIRNPLAAGNRIITVSSFVHGDDVDEITVVIRRTTTVDPGEGSRGSNFTLRGRGYADGTVTVFDGDDKNIDAGELLGSVNTSSGAFNLNLTARGDQGQPYAGRRPVGEDHHRDRFVHRRQREQREPHQQANRGGDCSKYPGHRRTSHQRYTDGEKDPHSRGLGDLRPRRDLICLLQLPVAGRRRRHRRCEQLQLQADLGRDRENHEGHGLLHRRRGQRRGSDKRRNGGSRRRAAGRTHHHERPTGARGHAQGRLGRHGRRHGLRTGVPPL